ncbi:MAG TPA: PKD domain-containing protein [Candidatus Saccharimonadales bacterium]
MKNIKNKILLGIALALVSLYPALAQVTNPQTGSVGIEGTIPTDPPTVGATISFPTNGQTFRDIPIKVQGICPKDLLVKLFKNQVFAGAVPCSSQGTFELEIDLFSGKNELVAKVFDSLDQPGPDSNKVTVTYDDGPQDDGIAQLILTSNFALRGANAGTPLTWPLAISGGVRPFAISVDWGDGETSQLALDLAGNFTVEHTYFEPGVYRMVVRATDGRGKTAFIQLVAVANGPSAQDANAAGTGESGSGLSQNLRIPLLPIYVMFFFVISTFWLGRRYEVRRIKNAVRTGKAVQL